MSFVIGSTQDSLDAAESMEGKKIERESSPGQLDASSAVRGRETGVTGTYLLSRRAETQQCVRDRGKSIALPAFASSPGKRPLERVSPDA